MDKVVPGGVTGNPKYSVIGPAVSATSEYIFESWSSYIMSSSIQLHHQSIVKFYFNVLEDFCTFKIIFAWLDKSLISSRQKESIFWLNRTNDQFKINLDDSPEEFALNWSVEVVVVPKFRSLIKKFFYDSMILWLDFHKPWLIFSKKMFSITLLFSI